MRASQGNIGDNVEFSALSKKFGGKSTEPEKDAASLREQKKIEFENVGFLDRFFHYKMSSCR